MWLFYVKLIIIGSYAAISGHFCYIFHCFYKMKNVVSQIILLSMFFSFYKVEIFGNNFSQIKLIYKWLFFITKMAIFQNFIWSPWRMFWNILDTFFLCPEPKLSKEWWLPPTSNNFHVPNDIFFTSKETVCLKQQLSFWI